MSSKPTPNHHVVKLMDGVEIPTWVVLILTIVFAGYLMMMFSAHMVQRLPKLRMDKKDDDYLANSGDNKNSNTNNNNAAIGGGDAAAVAAGMTRRSAREK